VAERDGRRLIGASNPQLKLLCIAVAQGILRYLADHDSDSFQVNGTDTGTNKVTGMVDIYRLPVLLIEKKMGRGFIL
jgi:hypothetical protein